MFDLTIDNEFINETAEITETAINKIVGKVLESVKYGTGTIIKDGSKLTVCSNVPCFVIAAEFADGIHKFMYNPELKAAKFPEELANYIPEIQPIIDTALNNLIVRTEEQYEQRELARQKKIEELAQKEKEDKLKAKLESIQRSNLRLASQLERSKTVAVDDFYIGLGYLAKHAKKVSVTMPDYMETWFTRVFGDVEHKTVDSNKRTVNGNPMQWTLSMDITLDTNEGLPAVLMNHLSSSKKAIQSIADTQFVFGLVRDYGFTFGKKQNIDEIRSHVPASVMADFEFGMGL